MQFVPVPGDVPNSCLASEWPDEGPRMNGDYRALLSRPGSVPACKRLSGRDRHASLVAQVQVRGLISNVQLALNKVMPLCACDY